MTEIPACAAIKFKDGVILAGKRHPDCRDMAITCGRSIKDSTVEQGFMTTQGRFVGRIEARKLMETAGIPSASGQYRNDKLYSEDLY